MNNVVVGILIVVVIAIVGWIAYNQGYFQGAEETDSAGLEINLGGASDANQ